MKKVKLKREQMQGFCTYIDVCLLKEFEQGKTITELIHCILTEIRHRVHRKALDIVYKAHKHSDLNKSVTIAFERSEVLALSIVFNYVPVPSFLAHMEYKLLEGI